MKIIFYQFNNGKSCILISILLFFFGCNKKEDSFSPKVHLYQIVSIPELEKNKIDGNIKEFTILVEFYKNYNIDKIINDINTLFQENDQTPCAKIKNKKTIIVRFPNKINNKSLKFKFIGNILQLYIFSINKTESETFKIINSGVYYKEGISVEDVASVKPNELNISIENSKKILIIFHEKNLINTLNLVDDLNLIYSQENSRQYAELINYFTIEFTFPNKKMGLENLELYSKLKKLQLTKYFLP